MNTKIKKLIITETIISLVVLILYIICNSRLINIVPNCTINKKFNILCPSCGATRCIINIFNFKIITAFLYNPLIFILIIYFVILNFVYIYNTITNNQILKFLYSKNVYIIIITIIILFTIFRNIL